MKLNFMLCAFLSWMCLADTIYAQSCCAGGGSCCSTAGGDCCASLLPDMDRHLIGLKYTYSSYSTLTYPVSTMIMSSGMDMSMMGTGQPTSGMMSTVDVYGRFRLPYRLQVAVDLPLQYLRESYTGTISSIAGLGDASVLIQYAIFDPKKFAEKKHKHQIRIGAGVKVPTGKFSMTNDGLFTSDLQMGTGSVDFLFNTMYTYRYKKFGYNLSAAYRKNLANKYGYRFGDRISAGGNAFYTIKLKKGVSVLPRAGLSYSHSFFNVYSSEALTYTGADVLKANAGADVYYKHFVFSASVSPVLMSITHWVGEATPLWSLETGIYYMF